LTHNGEITVTDHGKEMTLEEFNERKREGIRRGMRFIIAVSLLVAIAGMIALCSGCTPLSTQLREDGFNRQYRAWEMIQGAPAEAETVITVRVIVTEALGWNGKGKAAATYSTSPQGGTIRIRGKMVNGKIVVSEAALGHECFHALQFQDGRFVNPDEMRRYEDGNAR
jgi:hypothetical protein